MGEPLIVAKDLQRVAEGRLAGKRALNVLAKAVAELAGVKRPSYDLAISRDQRCIKNLERARKHAKRLARDVDRSGYSVHELFMDLLLLRITSERIRMDGQLLSAEELAYRNDSILTRIAFIEIYVARLAGIHCEADQDILETNFAHPAMKKAILKLRD